jgi:hypothetical protein
MALRSNLSKDDGVFIGKDKNLRFTIYTTSAKTAIQDVTSFTLEFLLRRDDQDANAHIVKKITGSGITISGTYNSAPAVNTQKVTVALEDTDTDGVAPGTYRYTLNRTDSGSEDVLAFGSLPLQLAGGR